MHLFSLFRECQRHPIWEIMSPGTQTAVSTLGEMVADAQRFTLDRAATMMIQNLSRMPDRNFVNAIGLCRLPFEKMWIEFVFRDRTDWLMEAMTHGLRVQPNESAEPPLRLGFFAEQVEHSYGQFIIVQPAWTHIEPGIDVCRKAMVIDINPEPANMDLLEHYRKNVPSEYKTPEDKEAFAQLASRINYVIPQYLERYWGEIRRMGPDMVAKYEELTDYDLAAEWRFVLSLLIAINSRNLLKMGEEPDLTKLNKARAKSGKPPVLAHREIKLSLSKVQKHRIARGYYDHSGAPRDAHWVMGHLKVRKTGVFWWSPHTRGGDAEPKSHIITG